MHQLSVVALNKYSVLQHLISNSTRISPWMLIIWLQKGQSMFSQPHCMVELLGAFIELTTMGAPPPPYSESSSMWPDRICPVVGATSSGRAPPPPEDRLAAAAAAEAAKPTAVAAGANPVL